MAVTLVYETHSTTIDNEMGIATGWLPGELSEIGRKQAAEMGKRRRADGTAAVYTSDLVRTVATAEIAFRSTDITVVRDERLRECNYGEFNGTSAADLPRAKHIDEPFPGGESYQDVVTRMRSFVDDMRTAWTSSERIVVISHAAPRLALEVLVNGRSLHDIVGKPFGWQPGWEYEL